MLLIDLGQIPEQLFLAFGQMPWGFHEHRDQQITVSCAAQAGHAFAGNPDDFATLNAPLQVMLNRAVQSRNFDLATQGGLAKRNRHLANQVRAVALEELMLANAQKDIEIAARPTRIARFSLAVEPDPRAVIHARGHGYVQRSADHDSAVAMAVRAGVGDNVPAAAAPSAGL